MTENQQKAVQYEPAPWWWGKILSPVGAWLVACMAGSFVMSIGNVGVGILDLGQRSFLLFVASMVVSFLSFMIFSIVVSGPVSPIIVWLMRVSRIPRGWSDSIIAALVAFSFEHFLLSEIEIGSSLFFFIAGAAGGLTYWLAAGRPKPPY